MIIKNEKLTPQEKIQIFRQRFSGYQQAYGTYEVATKHYSVVKEPVTDQVIINHLRGEQSYGVFLLVKNQIRTLAVDFDSQDREPVHQFLHRAKHYEIPAYVETSKSKGFHVWIFFDDNGILALKARVVINQILQETDFPQTEVFPKQDSIDRGKQFGNFINAPLFGALVPYCKTVFLSPNKNFQPYKDQGEFLQNVQLISEKQFDHLIEVNDWFLPPKEENTRGCLKKVNTSFSHPERKHFGMGQHERMVRKYEFEKIR